MRLTRSSPAACSRRFVRRYLVLTVALVTVMLAVFFIVDSAQIGILTDPTPWLVHADIGAAALGVGLLVGDVVLPVPSSVVMVGLGAQFGVAIGTLLSLAGSVGGAAIGFVAGRRGSGLLHRHTTQERQQAERALARWGMVAVVLTRPVPILAETVAVLAGASRMGWPQFLSASVAGTLPAALLYAVAGTYASSFVSTATVFLGVVALAGAAWAVRAGRLRGPKVATRLRERT